MRKHFKKRRLFFLTRSLHVGGAERQLVMLAKGLDKTLFHITVGLFYDEGALRHELANVQGVQLVAFRKGGRWDILPFGRRLVKFLKSYSPDIMYTFLPDANIVGLVCGKRAGVSEIVWGIRASNMDLSQYDWLPRISSWCQQRLSRFPDLVIANSQAGLNYAVGQGFPKGKMVVVRNGIDTDLFCPDRKAREYLRKVWGIPRDKKLIGLVARLDPKKGHLTFFKAAAMFLREERNVRFVCVGEGPKDYRDGLELLAENLGLGPYLTWAGECRNMPAVYNALDIACSSSSFGEGCPNVVAEAMACGVPCVVTDVGDSAQIVGQWGEVVPPGRPEAMTQALKRTFGRLDDEPGMKEQVRARIVDNFNVGLLVKHTENALKGLTPMNLNHKG